MKVFSIESDSHACQEIRKEESDGKTSLMKTLAKRIDDWNQPECYIHDLRVEPSNFASSKKSVGSFWFRKCPQSMIQRYFNSIRGFETVGLSHSQFGLVVEALDDATGKLTFCFKPVDDQRFVLPDLLCHLLHRIDFGAHSSCAAPIQKLSSPVRRYVLPQLLEVFLKQVGAH